MKDDKKTSFVMYGDYFDTLLDYDRALLGDLFLMLLYYGKTRIEPEINNDVANALFKMFKHQIDFDTEKYKERCERNRANINKRWGKNDDEPINVNDS